MMTPRPFEAIAIAAAPVLFALLWASGFIGAKLGLPHAEPLTFLALRMLIAVALLGALVAATRPRWPDRAGLLHGAVTGLLAHGIYLGGVFIAIERGLPTGIVALIVALQPVLTSTIASRWLGEQVRPEQWVGLALGLAGVGLVVWGRTGGGAVVVVAWVAVVTSLLGITFGTLYQKRFGTHIDWRPNLLVQYAAAAALLSAGALALESRQVDWTPEFVFALGWLVLVLSFGAVWLLYFLIRRAPATRVASYFYLSPPITALMAWLWFDERLGPLSLAGMIVCVAGVFLVNRRAFR